MKWRVAVKTMRKDLEIILTKRKKDDNHKTNCHILERVIVGFVLHNSVWREVEDALEGVSYARCGGCVLCRPVPY